MILDQKFCGILNERMGTLEVHDDYSNEVSRFPNITNKDRNVCWHRILIGDMFNGVGHSEAYQRRCEWPKW